MSPTAHSPVSSSLRALAAVADVPLAVGVGLAVYLLAIFVAVPWGGVMPQSLRRIVEVHRFLRGEADDRVGRPVVFLGSSVTLEGIDCEIVDERMSSHGACRNLAWTGAVPRQWLLMASALKAARPSAVVVSVDLSTLVDADPVAAQRLTIAGWWRFLDGTDAPTVRSALSADELSIVDGSRSQQLLRFRTMPLDALNEYLREIARPELRYDGYTTNFVAPWVRRTRVSPAAVAVGLRGLREKLTGPSVPQGLARSTSALRVLLNVLRDAKSTRFIVLSPTHPDLVRELPPPLLPSVRDALSALARDEDARFIDDSELLAADAFSDALHPFTEGRRLWSISVGNALGAANAR